MSFDTQQSRHVRWLNEAKTAERAGKRTRAARLYRLASRAALAAIRALGDQWLPRTHSVVLVSAAWCAFRGDDYARAEAIATRALDEGGLQQWAIDDLRRLAERAKAAGAAYAEAVRRLTRLEPLAVGASRGE